MSWCYECLLSKTVDGRIKCEEYPEADAEAVAGCSEYIPRSHEWQRINNKWYCPNCGHVTEFRNSACPACGWKIEGETDEETN